MNAIDKFRDGLINARKRREADKVDVLSTFIGEVERRIADRTAAIPDEVVIKVLTKQLADSREASNIFADRGEQDKVRALENEIAVLTPFLEAIQPKQMTDDEVVAAVTDYVSANPGPKMGAVMGYLKQNFGGRYDAAKASQLVKSALTQ